MLYGLHAPVLAGSRARRALVGARLDTLVSADERTTAVGRAGGVQAAAEARSTRPAALVLALQPRTTALRARNSRRRVSLTTPARVDSRPRTECVNISVNVEFKVTLHEQVH